MTEYNTNLSKRCYQFSLAIIELTDTLPNKRAAWIITDQLIRSSTSIGANLTEAKASSSRLEFKKYHEISLKSANESLYWLNLLKDAKLASQDNVDPLIRECQELANMIATSVMKLKSKNF